MALPKQSDDFPKWYQEVVKQADLAEPSFARGTMVIKPYGFGIWEKLQQYLDGRIKETPAKSSKKHQNLYFPMFIPSKLLEQEKQHVEGFAPEVALVTKAGGKDLEEPMVVRPTSEALIWGTYAKWIQSYRDLPLLYNQWANVVRWEMRPRLFLRTTEFLWQEGHTAHETADEASREARDMLEVYRQTAEEFLGIPVIKGRKSPSERFPGADETYTIEALMKDGKALQAATSHDLGQNFAKTYDVSFTDASGEESFVYATSWGMSTRIVGGIIMAHGDDKGLQLPPEVAPYQVVIVPIITEVGKEGEGVSKPILAANKLRDSLEKKGVRAHVDSRDNARPGFKFNEWELRGVPVRIELGTRDLAKKSAIVSRRDKEGKSSIKLADITEQVPKLLKDIQEDLFTQAKKFRDKHTHKPKDYKEMVKLLNDQAGFVVTGWCGMEKCEQQVKKETSADIRCLTLEPEKNPGKCLVCGMDGTEKAYWAKAY